MILKKEINFTQLAKNLLFCLYSLYAEQLLSLNTGPIKQFFLQNFNIAAELTIKMYKIQNLSPKNSHL
jgi:hypothetical protein